MINIEVLKEFDTPTICNALKMIDNNRSNYGYTTKPIHSINNNKVVVGIAKTATVRSLRPSILNEVQIKEERLKYYTYIDKNDFCYEKVCIMQDLDNELAGRGVFWGEFNTRIHKSLGVKGIITNGSVRDVTHLPNDILILSKGLVPSHANIHIVDYNVQVNVFDMVVNPNDIVHADIHGAVTFPLSLVPQIITNALKFIEDEKPIIEGCKNKNLTIEQIAELYMRRT